MSSVLPAPIIRQIRGQSERKPGDMDGIQDKPYWKDEAMEILFWNKVR